MRWPVWFSVVVNAPSVFRATAATSPERHLEAARALTGDARDAGPADGAEILSSVLVGLMRDTRVPNGATSAVIGLSVESHCQYLEPIAFPEVRVALVLLLA
jgi:hydroxyacid-oxoacid transhydrogenase